MPYGLLQNRSSGWNRALLRLDKGCSWFHGQTSHVLRSRSVISPFSRQSRKRPFGAKIPDVNARRPFQPPPNRLKGPEDDHERSPCGMRGLQ
jgi:hypothetical protein